MPDASDRHDTPDTLDRLLDALPRLVLVGGKGGVGKSTAAAALALRAAARTPHARTLLLSTDPARALPDVLAAPVGPAPAPVAGVQGLHAAQLDAGHERQAFLGTWRDTIARIVDRGTYLDRDDIDGLVDAALPGSDETFAVLALADRLADPTWTRVVVDTAPTGHTLRLLALPETFEGLLRLLDTMQGKHRFMVRALTHRYRADEADAFLDAMRARVGALRAALADAAHTRVLLVARAEGLVAAETARYADALAATSVRVGAVVVNAVPSVVSAEARDALAGLDAIAQGAIRAWAPALAATPLGLAGLTAWQESLRSGTVPAAPGLHGAQRTGAAPDAARPHPEVGGAMRVPDLARLVRPLTIVGGKGGVGKTTVACALAVLAASPDRPVLLVSTDPAPSVGDALDLAVGDEETPVPGAPGLVARQMDAEQAFARLRADYEGRVDAVFDGLLGGALDAAHDRAVVRDLLRLAPPGVDELYALALLGDALDDGGFARVVVDPAPTGHLLRLLEMPALALAWSHRLMRLMLKYREAAPLGDAAAELLAFARRTRRVAELLRDPSASGVLVVALDEPLVRRESARLVGAVTTLGASVPAVVWNRADAAPAPLERDANGAHLPSRLSALRAPTQSPAPRGVPALRAWAARWTSLTDADA